MNAPADRHDHMNARADRHHVHLAFSIQLVHSLNSTVSFRWHVHAQAQKESVVSAKIVHLTFTHTQISTSYCLLNHLDFHRSCRAHPVACCCLQASQQRARQDGRLGGTCRIEAEVHPSPCLAVCSSRHFCTSARTPQGSGRDIGTASSHIPRLGEADTDRSGEPSLDNYLAMPEPEVPPSNPPDGPKSSGYVAACVLPILTFSFILKRSAYICQCEVEKANPTQDWGILHEHVHNGASRCR